MSAPRFDRLEPRRDLLIQVFDGTALPEHPVYSDVPNRALATGPCQNGFIETVVSWGDLAVLREDNVHSRWKSTAAATRPECKRDEMIAVMRWAWGDDDRMLRNPSLIVSPMRQCLDHVTVDPLEPLLSTSYTCKVCGVAGWQSVEARNAFYCKGPYSRLSGAGGARVGDRWVLADLLIFWKLA